MITAGCVLVIGLSVGQVRDRVLTFLSKDLPLMTLLANPGIKERHWEQMAVTVGFPLPHSEVRAVAARPCAVNMSFYRAQRRPQHDATHRIRASSGDIMVLADALFSLLVSLQSSTLDEMLKLGLGPHLPAIEETCINAQKEYSLEKALERMIEVCAHHVVCLFIHVVCLCMIEVCALILFVYLYTLFVCA